MNQYPSKADDPVLFSHDLEALANRLGVSFRTFDTTDPSAASWKIVLEWRRSHGYAIDKLPMKVAEQMIQAAFGSIGVVEWLAKRFQLDI